MKGALKVSKEQVIEIECYCDEHGITRKQRIDELGLSHTAYYYTRGLVLYMTVLERGERYTGKRTIDYSNLDVVENVIDPQEVLDAPEDFASMEKLLPGGLKKSHPESHSMVHHTTEAKQVTAILNSRAKRKESCRNRYVSGRTLSFK